MSSNIEILKMPLSEVVASSGFKETAVSMGFLTLQDIINAGVPHLIKTEGFSYRWCHELFQVLDNYGLLHLIESQS